MSRDQFNHDEQYITQLIKEFPQKEVPDGLTEQIMKRVGTAEPPLWKRICIFLSRSVTIELQPLRVAGAFCSLALAFWLGLLMGGKENTELNTIRDPFNELITASRNAEANYYMGRSFMAEEQWEQAALFLQKASSLVPENPEYSFLRGIAVGKLGNKKNEQNIYRNTIAKHPDYIPAHLFLGHSLLESGQYEAALTAYDKVLLYSPEAENALYNRALAYQFLGKQKEEAAAWKEYLFKYRGGRWAYRAIEHLNKLGDFTFRGYQIGFRQVIINQELLLGPDTNARQREIEYLANSFHQASGNELNIIVFQADSKLQAAKKAKGLKKSVIASLKEQKNKTVKISWFGQPETGLKVSGENYSLAESLLIFSNPKVKLAEEQRHENSI